MSVILLLITLVTDLFLLLALTIYISLSHKWTASFDSSAMMRLGAAQADAVN